MSYAAATYFFADAPVSLTLFLCMSIVIQNFQRPENLFEQHFLSPVNSAIEDFWIHSLLIANLLG